MRMARDRIRYEVLVQDALRSVIHKVLSDVAEIGLPGEHHFFITFLTNAPGVRVSPRLKERYPEQMTIVLQHQFWDLKVDEDHFEVTLSFGDIPEKLVVPFSALQVFYDPTAAFEAAFDMPDLVNANSVLDDSIEKIIKDDALILPAKAKTDKTDSGETAAEATNNEEGDKQGADVVSLDAFRKNK